MTPIPDACRESMSYAYRRGERRHRVRAASVLTVLLLSACAVSDDPRQCDSIVCAFKHKDMARQNEELASQAQEAQREVEALNESLALKRGREAELRQREARLKQALDVQRERLGAMGGQLDRLREQGRIDLDHHEILQQELQSLLAQIDNYRTRRAYTEREAEEVEAFLETRVVALSAAIEKVVPVNINDDF